ncbi:hypothetical protein D3C73_1207290 [compost metagenome]
MNNIIHDCPPIRHNNTLKSPLIPKNRSVQIIIGSSPVPVHRIIGSHYRIRAPLPHRHLETFQINFSKSAFRNDSIYLAAVFFLIVAGEVL